MRGEDAPGCWSLQGWWGCLQMNLATEGTRWQTTCLWAAMAAIEREEEQVCEGVGVWEYYGGRVAQEERDGAFVDRY